MTGAGDDPTALAAEVRALLSRRTPVDPCLTYQGLATALGLQPPGTIQRDGSHELFWSLSFAVKASTWDLLGGFAEEYVGYGAEDTDLGRVARERGVELVWVGGAHAYHQHHPVSRPPVEHLVDIVRNASIYWRRWHEWPMSGWLDEFERQKAEIEEEKRREEEEKKKRKWWKRWRQGEVGGEEGREDGGDGEGGGGGD